VSRRLAIVQSNYIPWKGYFDLLNLADEFILYDHVQYTRNDWRNRNRIKTPQGVQWLSIPVRLSGRFGQTIDETEVATPAWARAHWKTLVQNYSGAAYFAAYRDRFEELYLGLRETRLSAINFRFIEVVCQILGIRTRISWSRDYRLVPGRTEVLVDLCRQVGATEYISGPKARAYIEEDVFTAKGVRLTWMDYSGYPEYAQVHPPFEHAVTVLDLIFHLGPEAPRYMKSFGARNGMPGLPQPGGVDAV
jgi:hypothetical protein